MQQFYIGNSLLGDELAIAQQLISDILTCFGAGVLDRAPLAAEAPHRGTSCRPRREIWHPTEKNVPPPDQAL